MLQQRAKARHRRERQPRGGGVRAALVAVTVLGLGLLSIVLIGTLAGIQLASTSYAAINRDLPSINQISSRETFKTAQIFDRKGRLLWEFYAQDAGRRTVVPLSEVSQYLIDATLAAEDANFYSNPGIEPRGILRALYQNIAEQEVVSGASTITQQLVKNVLIPEDERYAQRGIAGYQRKVKEALLAYQVTQKLSKSQILSLYLNEILYGNQAFGVEAASQTYFAKHARDLTLAEAAVIAGLPQSPSVYDPFRNPVAAKARQTYVLDQMVKNDFITEQEADAARQAELPYQRQKPTFLAPHWAMYIRSLIEEKYGTRVLYQGGLRIYTSLDFDLQTRMEEVAESNAPNLAQRDAENTAIVVMNPKTGEILAMVGSMDYYNADIDGQVNVAISERQPGSTIKPIVYLTTFMKGWVPSTTIVDEKISIPDDLGRVWEPENYDKRFRGTVTVRTALGNSLNIPAVKAIQFAEVPAVADLARKMGITTWKDNTRLGLAMALGGAEVRPLDIVSAYTVLANNGLRIPPVAITRIIDADGNTVEEYKVPQGEQVVDPRYAYMITNILSDNNARLITYGPDSLLKLGRPAAVKTGTTDSYRDTWTIGYTPNLAIGVWVGNSDNHPMKEVLSSMSAGKIWRESMDAAIGALDLPAEEFVRPAGLLDVEVCGDAAMRPGAPTCYPEVFPVERAPRTQRVYLTGTGAQQPAAPAPVQPPGPAQQEERPAAESTPGAAPTSRPVLVPSGPLIPPANRPNGPPPQATPAPRATSAPRPTAPRPTAQPASRPAAPQPTPAQSRPPQPPAQPAAKPQAKPQNGR
ncbi:MAG: PBP1A family penicillin-binding protein [Chloroflexi bacterium]|nr:PBP1A family penicillin-binding protein [Chloroflexota bacterium]